MKKKLSFIVALWWVILSAILGLFLLILSSKESRLSTLENRMLAGFPALNARSLVSGEFMTGFDSFLSDGFLARDEVITFSDQLLSSFSTLSKDDQIAAQAADMEQRLDAEGGQADLVEEETEDVPATSDTTETTVETVSAGPIIAEDFDDPEEEFGDVTAPDDDSMLTEENCYLWLKRTGGGNKIIYTYKNSNVAIYAETLRMIQSFLPDDGNIFVTQVPLASIANRWIEQPESFCGWGSTVETALENALAGTERIHVFNTWEILEPYMTGDTLLFYKTDHHWSAEGAYIVAMEMIKSQGLPTTDYEEYEYKHITSDKSEDGYHDTFNVLHELLPVESYVCEKRQDTQELSLMNYRSTSYTTYMNNSRQPWRRVITGANTGRKALVICDSFGNAFTPYLLPYYDEVHMTDFRNDHYSIWDAGGTISENMQYYGIDDVYLIFCTANGLRKPNSLVYLREYLLG